MRDLGRRAFSGCLGGGVRRRRPAAGLRRHARARAPARAGASSASSRSRSPSSTTSSTSRDLGLGAALSTAPTPRTRASPRPPSGSGSAAALVLLALSLGDRARCSARSDPATRSSPCSACSPCTSSFTALGKAHEYRLRRSLEFRKLFWPQLANGADQGRRSASRSPWPAPGAWSLSSASSPARCASRSAALAGLSLAAQLRRSRAASCPADAALRARHRRRRACSVRGPKNFDYLVVGAKLGAAALGVYYLAFRLPELVILSGFQRGQRRAVPVLRAPQGGRGRRIHDELRRGYLQTVRLGPMVALPAAFGDGRAGAAAGADASTARTGAPRPRRWRWSRSGPGSRRSRACPAPSSRRSAVVAADRHRDSCRSRSCSRRSGSPPTTASPPSRRRRWSRRRLAGPARRDHRPRPRHPLVRDLRRRARPRSRCPP